MISDGKLSATEIEPASAKLGHGRIDRQESLRRDRSQRYDRLRFNGCDLPHQERRAGLALIPLGRSVSRRTALDDVRDVNVFTPQAHGLDHVVEQLSGAANEWLALLVFIRARRFADKHQFGFRVAHPEHYLLASLFVQAATRAIAQVLTNQPQRLNGISHT